VRIIPPDAISWAFLVLVVHSRAGKTTEEDAGRQCPHNRRTLAGDEEVDRHKRGRDATVPSVSESRPQVDLEARWRATGWRGGTVWFTGLPGSGKSTIAGALEHRLVEAGRPAMVVDGDNLRFGLCADLGFDRESRVENVRRAGEVARLLAEAGVLALVALISPYAESRQQVRMLHAQQGLSFVEVWVSTPLDECERRDPKGLYSRARAGELAHLTGVGDPYEPPAAADLVLAADRTTVPKAVDAVVEVLVARGLFHRPALGGEPSPSAAR
jgi:adenylyl-sulfate kinase